MSRRHPERNALAITPAPDWLHALAEANVRQAAAWSVQGSVFVRVATADGAGLIQLVEDARATLHAHRIEGSPPKRRALPIDTQRESIHAFYRRFLWMHSRGPAPFAGHRPSDVEVRYLTVARALGAVYSVDDARAEWPARHEPASDPTLRAVDRFMDVLRGRWDRVFAAPDEDAPDWLRPILTGLGGDAEAMRRMAEARVGARPDAGSLALIAATAYENAGFHDAAYDGYTLAQEHAVGPLRADLAIELAGRSRLRGRRTEAVQWARRALLVPTDEDTPVERASLELILSGAFDDAYAALRARARREPVGAGIAIAIAELLLWAGRAAAARPWVERASKSGGDGARALRAKGALAALERRWSDARHAFERVLELDPSDGEAGTWLAEIHLRLGDAPAAERALTDSRAIAQTPAHDILGPAIDDFGYRSRLPLAIALLEALGLPTEPWLEGAERARPAALALLDRLGGNRGSPTTWITHAANDEGLGIEIVRLPEDDSRLSSRDAAADTIKHLATEPFDQLRRRFDALAERFPTSAHPLCYQGELDLWLGDYDEALSRFRAALEREKARWGYVGQAAVHVLRGEHELADERLAECAARYTPVPGATTHVYLGESLRRRGDLTPAIAELEEAVRVKPGRVGAWMNLALAHHERGDATEARAIFDRLAERVPRLYWDAWLALDGTPRWPLPFECMPELFEEALDMMRGNRSSHLITYFDRDGVFRIARDASSHRETLARHASLLGLALMNRLAIGVASPEGR